MSNHPPIQDRTNGPSPPRRQRRRRRRRCQLAERRCQTEEEISPFVDWASLPPDFLISLSDNLPTSVDYVRLRSVCRRWRSVVPPRKFPPLLLLPFQPDSLHFYDAASGGVHSFPIPLDITGLGFLGSSRGWIFLIDILGFVYLLNPFNGARFNLPKVTEDLAQASDVYLHKNMNDETWIFISDVDWPEEQPDEIPIRPSRMRLYFISEIILLASPPDAAAADGGGCLVVAVLASSGKLAFCQIGDIEWKLQATGLETVDSVASHGEMLCAVDEKAKMVAVFRADRRRETPLDYLFKLSLPDGLDRYRLLMRSEQELAMIGEVYDCRSDLEYEIYWCSLEAATAAPAVEWRRVESLGKETMFVSTHFMSSTFMGEFHGCRANAVVFSDPEFGIHGERSGLSGGDQDRVREKWIKVVDLEKKRAEEVACNVQVENSIDISWFTPSLC